MVYLLKKNFTSTKQVRQGLKQVKGLGSFSSNQLCDQLGLNSKFVMGKLSRMNVEKMERLVASFYLTGYELNKEKTDKIRRLITLGTYRGFRHVNALPCRGQRTRTNAKTHRRLNRSLK